MNFRHDQTCCEPNNILLTRNLPFDSDVRQWSYLLMIQLHCLNNRTRDQFECDVTWFLFLFLFCSIVCLRFQFEQYKQEMPSRQQKSAKNGPKRYIIFGPNQRTFTWLRKCLSVVFFKASCPGSFLIRYK